MAIKVFESAQRPEAAEAATPSPLTPLPFRLPGGDHIYTAHPPKEAIWQQVSLAGRPNAPVNRRIQVLLNYLRGTLSDPDDAEQLEERLLNAADPLDLPNLFPVINHLSQVWTAQSKRAAGKKLTDDEQALLDELEQPDQDTIDGETAGEGTIELVTDPAPKATAARKRAARTGP